MDRDLQSLIKLQHSLSFESLELTVHKKTQYFHTTLWKIVHTCTCDDDEVQIKHVCDKQSMYGIFPYEI